MIQLALGRSNEYGIVMVGQARHSHAVLLNLDPAMKAVRESIHSCFI